MVERLNRTLEAQLFIFVDHHQLDWDLHIPYLMMAYRSAVHESTQNSPASLMLGRELKLPIDLLVSGPEVSNCYHLCSVRARMEEVHQFTRGQIHLASDRMKRYYNAAVHEMSYCKGDPVWLFSTQRKKDLSSKLIRPWQGQFLVLKKINDVSYRIQLNPRTKPKIVHHNRLAPYQGPTMLDVPQEGNTQDARTPHDRALVVAYQRRPSALGGGRNYEETSPPLRRQRLSPDRYGQSSSH